MWNAALAILGTGQDTISTNLGLTFESIIKTTESDSVLMYDVVYCNKAGV